MSHFAVAVFTDGTKTVDELLAPYMENSCAVPDKKYMKFYEDEECDVDPETGKSGYWQNPNAKWDWYQVGGRYGGTLRLKDGARADFARVGDCDFSPNEEIRADAIDFWERVIYGKGAPEEKPFTLYSKDFYVERFGTKEKFAECQALFGTWAVVTPDGKWYEKGEMGWFACSDETHEEALAWDLGFKERFIDTADPDWFVTIVDCHI